MAEVRVPLTTGQAALLSDRMALLERAKADVELVLTVIGAGQEPPITGAFSRLDETTAVFEVA